MTDTKIQEFSVDSQIENQLNSKYDGLSRHGVRLSTQGRTLQVPLCYKSPPREGHLSRTGHIGGIYKPGYTVAVFAASR